MPSAVEYAEYPLLSNCMHLNFQQTFGPSLFFSTNCQIGRLFVELTLVLLNDLQYLSYRYLYRNLLSLRYLDTLF